MMRHNMPCCSAATIPRCKPLPGGDLQAGVEMTARPSIGGCYRRSLDLTMRVRSVTSASRIALAAPR